MLALARRARDKSRQSLQWVRLRRTLATLESTLRSGRQPDRRLISRLVHAWGNEAWSAEAPFLMAMLDWLSRTNGAIVECGTGVSTVMLAAAVAVSGQRVYSFEHDPFWADVIARRLPTHLRSHVEIMRAPIRSYGDFDWYSVDPMQAPRDIGFVVCDGPPGMTRRGRYGLLPVMRERLARGCIVLLDDTQRDDEQAILRRWCTEFDGEVLQASETFTVLRVAGDSQPLAKTAAS